MKHTNIIRIAKAEPLFRQLEVRFREEITSGRLRPGARLPSNSVLAAQTGTSIFTVQTALAPLVREGLLDRRPKIGTFVRSQTGRLACPAIYYAGELWKKAEFSFYRAVQQCLEAELEARGNGWRVFMDSRAESEQGDMPPELAQAIRRREVDALIAPLVSRADMAWMKPLSIPVAMLSSAPVPNRVRHNLEGMLCDTFAALTRQGCRSVGLITSILSPAGHDTITGDDFERFHAHFHTLARRAGLATREAWMRAPLHLPPCLEIFGYESFQSLWRESEHPDGLVVYPDVSARGVLTAALSLQVSMPGELKLALHVNDRLPFPCPVPAIRMVTDVCATAQALIRLADSQVQGKAPRPVVLDFAVREFDPPQNRTGDAAETC